VGAAQAGEASADFDVRHRAAEGSGLIRAPVHRA
jgi:hypothetical protein